MARSKGALATGLVRNASPSEAAGRRWPRAAAALLLALVLTTPVMFILVTPPAAASHGGSPYFGQGNIPPGCTTASTSGPHFTDDCYHMRVDLNGLDTPTIDVLIVPPFSPYPERDLRVLRQSVEMWAVGIDYLAPKMGLDWLSDGVDFHIFLGHPDDGADPEPLWFPKIVVVATNPAGGAGIGIDPLDFIFGTTSPCHGQPSPLASFADWSRLPGFENHHGGLSGTYVARCDNGGSVCFAVNGAIDPVPGTSNPIFGLFDLSTHEFGHCLTVGHVGDALDHTAKNPARTDIMSYTTFSFRKCVSTLDVEGFALRMSEFLAPPTLVANHNNGPGGKFQIQHPSDHHYASSTGLAADCPQPDEGLVPGARVNFRPEDSDPEGVPEVLITDPLDGATVPESIVPVAGTVDIDTEAVEELAAALAGPNAVTEGATARYTVTATGGQSGSGFTCEITATGPHTITPVAGSDGCVADVAWTDSGSFAVTGVADDGVDTAEASLAVTVTATPGLPQPDGSINGGITIFPVGSPLAYNEAIALATREAGDSAPKFLPGTNTEFNTRFTLDSQGTAGPSATGQTSPLGLPYTWHVWNSNGVLVHTVGCSTIQDGSATTPNDGFNCKAGFTMPQQIGRYFVTLQYDGDGRWVCHDNAPIVGAVPPEGIPACLKAFDVVLRDDALPEPGPLAASLEGPTSVSTNAAARYTLTASGGDSMDGYSCDITATGAHTRTVVANTNGCSVDVIWTTAGARTVTGVADDGSATASDSLDVTVTDPATLPVPNGQIKSGITIFPTGFPLAYNELVAFGTTLVGDPAPKFLPGSAAQFNTRFTKDTTGVAAPTASGAGNAAFAGRAWTWHIWKQDGTLVATVPCTSTADSTPGIGQDGINCIAPFTMPMQTGRYFTTLRYDADGRWACHSSPPIVTPLIPPMGIPACLKAFDVLTKEEVQALPGHGVLERHLVTVPLVVGDTTPPVLSNDAATLRISMHLEGLVDPLPTVSGSPLSYQVDFHLDHNWDGAPDGALPYRLTFDFDAVAGDLFRLFVLTAPDATGVRTLCPVTADLSQSVFNEDTWTVEWVVPLTAFAHDNHPARGGAGCAGFTTGGSALDACDVVSNIVGTVSTKAVLFSLGGLAELNSAPDYTLECNPLLAVPGGPYGGLIGAPIAITGSATGAQGGFACAWSTAGDGTFAAASACATTVTFATAGMKTITLTVTDSAGSATADTTVAVSQPTGERVELWVNGVFESSVPVDTDEATPTANWAGSVDLRGASGTRTIAARWFDDAGDLLDEDTISVTVEEVEADLEVVIDFPTEGATVDTAFDASGQVVEAGGSGAQSAANFVDPNDVVDGSHFALNPVTHEVIANLHDALADEPAYRGLVPATDGRAAIVAIFEGTPPSDLPRHLLPAGWDLLTVVLDRENAVPLKRDPLAATPENLKFPEPNTSPPAGIGPGSLVADGICTGNWIWRTDTVPPRFFMGTAGHCVIGDGLQGTGGPWDACVSGCNTWLLGGSFVNLVPIYAVNQGVGTDFAIAEIPSQHWDKIRPSMWYWGAASEVKQPGFPEISVQYGYGQGTKDTFLTGAAAGLFTNGQPWWGAGQVVWTSNTSPGDSGSALGTGIVAPDGRLRGQAAVGVVTHLCGGLAGGVPFLNCGTNVPRAQQLVKGFNGLDIRVMLSSELPPPTEPRTLQATAGDGQVSLTWTAPSFGTPTQYRVRWGTSSGNYPNSMLVPGTSATATGLTNGVQHFFVVSALNENGEGPNSAQVSATPVGVTPLPSAPQNLVAAAGDGLVSLSWEQPAAGAPISSYTVRWGTASGSYPNSQPVVGTSAVVAGLTNGVAHYFVVTATNAVGTGPPSGEASATPGAVPSAPMNLAAVAGDNQVALFWDPPVSDGGLAISAYNVKWSLDPSGTPTDGTMEATETSALVTGLVNGVTYYFSVNAENAVGEGPASLLVAATPSGGVEVEVRLAQGASTVVDWTPVESFDGSAWSHGFSGVPEGDLTLDARLLVDDQEVDTDQVLFNVVDSINRAPILSPIGDRQVDEGTLLEIQVAATDEDGDALELAAAPLPAGATFEDHGDDTGTFLWQPGFDQSGLYQVVFSASDGEFSPQETVGITVVHVNRPPALAPVGNQVVDEGQPLAFPVTAADPDGTPVALAAQGLPSGASFTDHGDGSGSFAWTPTFGQGGNYPIRFVATSDGLEDAEDMTVSVGDVPLPPELAPIGPKTVAEASLLAFTLSAVDPDGDLAGFSASPLPAGASLNAATGLFQWTPTYAQAGTYNVQFRATDSGGRFDPETVTITVDNVNRAPVWATAPPRSVKSGNLLNFVVGVADPDGQAITKSVVSAPAGVQVSSTSGGVLVRWTPTLAQVGAHTLVMSATDGSLSSQVTVLITVIADNPPVVALSGPQAMEVGPATYSSAGSSDPEGKLLTYAWSLEKDGATLATGSGSLFAVTYGAPGDYTVRLTVRDPPGNTATATLPVRIDDFANLGLALVGDDGGAYGLTDQAVVRACATWALDGEPIVGAAVTLQVTLQGPAGTTVPILTQPGASGTTDDSGCADVAVPLDVGSANLPGDHRVDAIVVSDSRPTDALQNTETDDGFIHYTVSPV